MCINWKILAVSVGILVGSLVGAVSSYSFGGEEVFGVRRKSSWVRNFGFKDSSSLHIRFISGVGKRK